MISPSFCRPLTDAELADLKSCASTPDHPTIIRFYEIAGHPLKDAVDDIDPRAFRIPQAQWVEIAEEIQAHAKGSMGPALQWMNIGPSSY